MENVPGSYKWSSEVVNNVKEANGNPGYIKENIAGCVRVLRAEGRNAESVADQTMGFVISESRLIARHSHEVKTGEYFKKLESEGRSSYMESFNWMELNGKTLGLIGYGQVGTRVANP